MPVNRLAHLGFDRSAPRFAFPARTQKAAFRREAFVPCPAAMIPTGDAARLEWQRSIYERAYEQARATVEERRQALVLASRWN